MYVTDNLNNFSFQRNVRRDMNNFRTMRKSNFGFKLTN